jgi:hypothetical protein
MSMHLGGFATKICNDAPISYLMSVFSGTVFDVNGAIRKGQVLASRYNMRRPFFIFSPTTRRGGAWGGEEV